MMDDVYNTLHDSMGIIKVMTDRQTDRQTVGNDRQLNE